MTTDNSNDSTSGRHEDRPTQAHSPSHTRLLAPVPRYLSSPRQDRLQLSGVVVPTIRPVGMGSGLALAARIAEAKDSQLVVIRSRTASERPFSEAIVPRTSARTAVIDLPPGIERMLRWRSNEHPVATLHRDNDVGFKRNLGLLIGRLCGWEALLFLDDDIRSTPASQPNGAGRSRPTDPLVRLNDVLADFATYPGLQAAGYFQRDMDDNSVVCHARRLVGRPQDIFISGGALAVRAGGPLPLFSAAYNEDWLFFQQLMLEGRHMLPSSAVRYIGTIHQDTYQPFTAHRALSEELGDLLGEGLFNLIEEAREDVLSTATSTAYWEEAIDERCRMISELLTDLYRLGGGARRGTMADADRALQAARSVYADPAIDPAESLAEFFDALLTDQDEWTRLLTTLTPASPNDALSLEDALKFLDLGDCVSWFGGASKTRVS